MVFTLFIFKSKICLKTIQKETYQSILGRKRQKEGACFLCELSFLRQSVEIIFNSCVKLQLSRVFCVLLFHSLCTAKNLPLHCRSLPVPEALIDSCPRLPSPGLSFWPPQGEHIGQWHLPQQLCPAMRADCITSTFWSNFSLKLTLTVTVNVCHQLWTLLVTVSASFLPYHVSEIL